MIKEMKQQLIKETIITEVKKQFLEKGILKTTLRGIAKKLGIAVGNIYYYYKSKNDICNVLWIEYTNNFLDFFDTEKMTPIISELSGLETLRYYYSSLLDYFYENPLYAEIIAFSMGEKPRSTPAPKEIRDLAKPTRQRIQQTLILLYEEGISDGSITAEIANPWYEAWSFNISYVAIIINMIRYNEITEDVYDYYVDTYIKRLGR